jgi:hypothetical protein
MERNYIHSNTPSLQSALPLLLQLVAKPFLVPVRPHSFAAFMFGDLGLSSFFQ